MGMRRVISYFYLFFIFSERAERGWGALPDFFFFFFPCSADHERDWPPCKVVFFGLATNACVECEKQQQQQPAELVSMIVLDLSLL